MVSKPPRLLPTLALAALWIAFYVLWLAVRPTDPAVTPRPAGQSSTTTTTTAVGPLSKFKP
jgi:hypothetical protein